MTFFPIREKALLNKKQLEIGDKTFLNETNRLIQKYPDINIQYMMNDQIQQQYPGVRANGDLIVTRNYKDIILGNMFYTIKQNPFCI